MKTLHTVALTGLLMGAAVLTPGVAFAYTPSATTSSALIRGDGTVHIWGAKVTDVSGNIITAVSAFGNKLLTWAVSLSGDTEVSSIDESGAVASSSAQLRAGDRIAVVGTLTDVGVTTSLTAQKVRELATSTKERPHPTKGEKDEKDIRKHAEKEDHGDSQKRGWALGLWHHFFLQDR